VHLGPEQGVGGGNRSHRMRPVGRRSNNCWPTGEAEQGVGGSVPGSGGPTNGSGGSAGEAEQGPRAGGRGGARTARRRERRSKDRSPASAGEAVTGGGANPSSAHARARSGQGEHAAGREKKEIRNEPLPHNQWYGG
jgi:hypothetical protein